VSRILIAEDEPEVVTFLEKGLRARGFTTTAVGDGLDAEEMARDADFDLLILDLGLPRLDGHEVLRRVRDRGERLPIIVLTARGSVDETVAGFEEGANDYLAKPFRFEELVARITARLRDDAHPEAGVLSAGRVSLDLRTRRAKIAEHWVELTAREFSLTETFLRHPNQVLSREQLLNHVWGYDFEPGSNVVEVYIRYLRQKFGSDAIETVRGMGYRFRDRDDD
jgi:DNA-binding response OmpR family regulator